MEMGPSVGKRDVGRSVAKVEERDEGVGTRL